MKKIQSKSRIALTGTPIQNNVLELWSIFEFLFPDYLGSFREFRGEFRSLLDMQLVSLDMSKMELTNEQTKVLNSLHQKVLPFIL